MAPNRDPKRLPSVGFPSGQWQLILLVAPVANLSIDPDSFPSPLLLFQLEHFLLELLKFEVYPESHHFSPHAVLLPCPKPPSLLCLPLTPHALLFTLSRTGPLQVSSSL